MLRTDLEQVVKVAEGGGSFWNRQQFADELCQPRTFQYVARLQAAAPVQAFICGRRLDEEAELLQLAVMADLRRQGIGSGLLRYTLVELQRLGVRSCFLELRASNSAARNLYEKFGFSQSGIRKGYYDNPQEDALLMVKMFEAGGRLSRP
jgi:ribosomal-protein-alanine N-acetyltransferase